MIADLDIDKERLSRQLSSAYGIGIERIRFLPFGDSAYSYAVACRDGQRYYLKLFDHGNDRQLRGCGRLDLYLPVVDRLHRQGLFTQLTYPIRTVDGRLKSVYRDYTAVLFNYLEGETLAEAYPFADDLVAEIGGLVAGVHLATPGLDLPGQLAEPFDISFADPLLAAVEALERAETAGDSLLAGLRQQVCGAKETIRELVALIGDLRAHAWDSGSQRVLCHGDIWGGNLMRHDGRIYLLDWESVQLAPREFDFLGYIGEEFPVFYAAYAAKLGRPPALDPDILRFYAYRHHLRNLHNWLHGILYGQLSKAQREHDLEMIREHCMNRWDAIEPQIAAVKAVLRS